MRIVVECYGASRNWCGAEQIDLDLNTGLTAGDAMDILASRFPEFAERRKRIAIAVGDAIAAPSALLFDGDRLALIPPVSGG